MPNITVLTPADVLTLAGASIVVSIILAALFAAIGWTDKPGVPSALKDRYGAAISLVVGIVVVGGFALAQHADLLSAILTGFLAGAGSKLVHDTSGALGGP